MRLNYANANFDKLGKFFKGMEWNELMEGKTVLEKYEACLDKYNEGFQKYVLVYRVRKSKHSWYNARCAGAKKIEDAAWKSNGEQYCTRRQEMTMLK